MRCSWWLGLAFAACFSPRPPAGAPCASTEDCPSSQVCDLVTRTCQPAGCERDCDARIADGAGGDTLEPGCWAEWLDGTPSLSTPRSVAGVNTSEREGDPALSADGLTLYFVRDGALYRSTRGARGAPWEMPQPVTELTSTAGEGKLAVSADHLTAIFDSRRGGGEGGPDLWIATRATTTMAFSTPAQMPLENVNDGLSQFDPELPADELRLYFSSNTGGAGQRIYLSTRASASAAFGPPEPVTITGGEVIEADPTLSPDERVLVYTSRVDDNSIPTDLYVATRTAATGPFTATQLAVIDEAAAQGDAELSSDGCELYFGSDRSGILGNRDIYVVDVAP